MKIEQDKMLSNFEKICTHLSTVVDKAYIITAQDLYSFSRFVIYLLQNDIQLKSKAFDHLSCGIRDYWQYQLTSDKDLHRCCSYTQLYQMIVLLNERDAQRADEQYVYSLKSKYVQRLNIFDSLNRFPGITFKKLQETLNYDAYELSKLLNILESDKLVISRGNGNLSYYMLTSIGRMLYNELK